MSEYDIQRHIEYTRERAERIANDYRAAQRPVKRMDSSERLAHRAVSWWRRRIAGAPAYRP